MSDSQSIARPLAIGAVCLGAGAALMYLMDPTRGAVRRTRTREKAASLSSASVDALARKAADLRNRATGAVASGKSWLRDEPVDDERLVARVRSKLGHITQSYSIEVEANNGHVTLSGSVPGNEVSRVVKGAKSIPGVRSIENRLSTFSPSGSDSSVNAGDGWSPRTRVMASAVGGGLLLWGLKSKGRVGKASATLGFGLLTRGLMNRETPGTTGLGDLRKLAGL